MSATIDSAIAAGLTVSVQPDHNGYLVTVGRGRSNASLSSVSARVASSDDIDATITTLRTSLEQATPELPSQDELDDEAEALESMLRAKYPGLANVQVVLRRQGN